MSKYQMLMDCIYNDGWDRKPYQVKSDALLRRRGVLWQEKTTNTRSPSGYQTCG